MSPQIHLADLDHAYRAQDPELAAMIAALAVQKDPEPQTPIREGAATFDRFLAQIQNPAFRKKPAEEQSRFRREQLKALESPDAEIPLPERLRVHEIIQELWEDKSPFARNCLLDVISRIRLTWGPWRALKKIAKEAEKKEDTEILGALAARFDRAYADGNHDIGKNTLGYMCRRMWRFLRRMGQSFPVAYADAAADFLVTYTDQTAWQQTWIANHILFHKAKTYSRRKFTCPYSSSADMLRFRAYPELWQRSFRPLLDLLAKARSHHVRTYAVAALKKDFRAMLRDVEIFWPARLIAAGNADADEFAVWLLSNTPRFEQSAFRDLGLHESVLKLFASESSKARIYAAEYARVHARDLSLETLLRLFANDEEALRNLAKDLIKDRDPRKDVGLDFWGRLLEISEGHDFAAEILQKHFTARELTPEWFRDRILSGEGESLDFAIRFLPQIHPRQKLGTEFFCNLVKDIDKAHFFLQPQIAQFAFEELARSDVSTLDPDFLRTHLIRPDMSGFVRMWMETGKLRPGVLGTDFLKTLAYHPEWEQSAWIAELKKSGAEWTKELEFSEDLSAFAMKLLSDVRCFSAPDLGFDWLMQLVGRSESRYHNFAVSVMIRSFLPADFAKKESSAKQEISPESAGTADFAGASFLFTGKLATMDRKQAQAKVTQANGKNASAVTAGLEYLVIGDEGSPLYGHGRKGSKQIKAEQLMEKGAGIRIISETAFLQMLSGKQAAVSEDAQAEGCERLWEMLTAPGTNADRFRDFAITYILRHHPEICLAETDRPVDPGAEIPPAFLCFERVLPLFSEERATLREFALKLAQWEFNRWSPDTSGLMKLCENSHAEVRAFVIRALTAEEKAENRRFRVDAAALGADALISFCGSVYADIRNLGMELIRRFPACQEAQSLFSLTESPDRQIRAFSVRMLWNLYRSRPYTAGWEPKKKADGSVLTSAKKKKDIPPICTPPERPENLPASHEQMRDLLRRILFEIPPGRMEKADTEISEDMPRLAPLPARKAKLCLIETLRDLAVEEGAMAEAVLPLLTEFMGSKGMSEQAACLVAATRIYTAHPHLGKQSGGGIVIRQFR